MSVDKRSDAMTRSRAALFIAVTLLVVITVLGVTAYAFRGRLAGAPVIVGLFSQAQSPAGPSGPTGAPAPGTLGDAAAPTPDARAQVAIDSQRQQLIGVRTAAVERTAITPTVRTVGLVRYDETRLAEINLKLEGWIRDLYVDFTGEFINKGQPLFTLYSPEVVNTQNEYLLALKTRDQLRQSQIADARERSERLVDAARQRLALWDLPPEEMQMLDETLQPRTAVVFRSPVSGYVIEKQALRGMHVMPGEMLYKIADLSAVWVEADIYEQELRLVRVGRPADVTLDAYPGEQFRGRAVYIYPFVEEKTRTVRVRFELPNPRARLKPGMYANVELRVPAGTGLTVPANAVLDSGTQQIVFVATGDGYFDPRHVRIGRRLGDRIEIVEGLKEGEQVATAAAFFLDSESQLRAGVQSYEEAPGPSAATGPAAAALLEITFRSQPDPPQTGENTFEVTIKDPQGQPVADAEVSVLFFMPAMPTMNMPAMRNETKLVPAGGGVYRGAGQVMMAGRWDVTVNVTRAGQRLGSSQVAVIAR